MTQHEIIMTFGPILALILGNAAFIIPLFLWNRSESRSDIKHMDSKLESFRAESGQIIRSIQEEIRDFHQKMAQESREFHGRLCEIEERNRK